MPATIVWLAPNAGAASASQEPAAAADAARALEEWARARGLRLATATEAKPRAIPVDLTIGDAVEADLERAHDAMGALDRDATEAALGRAQAALEGHPELPHAAWLMAEVMRAWAARFQRFEPADPVGVARAWKRADALDGGRASGVLETRAKGAQDELVQSSLVIDGAGSGLSLWVDGALVPPGPIARAAGSHQVVVTQGGATVWASWVTFAAQPMLHVGAGPAPACARDDFARIKMDDDGAGHVDASDVRCASWVAVTSTNDPRTIRVALCQASRCAPLAYWRLAPAPVASPFLGQTTPTTRTTEAGAESRFHWPAWATWTLVGVGVAAGTIAGVVASGAFEAAHTETRFVSGGVKVQAFTLPF